MKQVLILNGPPGSGKDALAEHLSKTLGFRHLMFKEMLYKLALDAAGLPYGYKILFTDRILKESLITSPFYIAGQRVTPRQWLIHVSENLIKPNFGQDFFGNAASDAVRYDAAKTTVFSDGGFKQEILPLLEVAEVTIIRITRPGHSFEGDSRTWLDPRMFPEHKVRLFVVENTGTLAEFFDSATKLVHDYVLN